MMPFTYEINGQDVEFDREPTEADIDEAASQLGGQQQQQQTGFTQVPIEQPQPQPQGDLGLSFLGKAALRGKLAFGDDPAQVQSFLQQRFPDREIKQIQGRKFSVDGIPIDPGEFSIPEMALDVIDISDEIVRLGSQIFGAAKGAVIGLPGGPGGAAAGAIIGGGVARAGGQAAVEAIGRGFGVQGAEGVGEIAKEIAIEGAIGATGEALGLGLRAISRPMGRFLRNFWNKIAQKGRVGEQMLVNFTSGAERESIARLQRVGVRVLNDENLADDALLRVGQKIQRAATATRDKLRIAVRTGKGIIKDKTKASIDLTDLKVEGQSVNVIDDFAKKLQDVGLLNRNFKPLAPDIGKLDTGQKQLQAIYKLLRNKKKISPAKALKWREELDRVLKFNQTGKITLTGGEDAIAKGLRFQLKHALINVSDDFAKANKNLTEFSEIADILKGKLDVKTVENFLKSTFSGQHIFEESLKKLEKVVGPTGKFLTKLEDVLAARSFAKTTFSGIRTGIFSGLLGGLGLVGGGPGGALVAVGTGITLSTPRIAGQAILRRQLIAKTLQSLLQRASLRAQQVIPKASSSLMRQLLENR